MTCCCPCIAYLQAAKNINPESSNGILYCLMTYPLGFGCCALIALAEEVAEKRGIDTGGVACSAVKAFFDCCMCYSCTVVYEARLHKEESETGKPVVAALPAAEMERK